MVCVKSFRIFSRDVKRTEAQDGAGTVPDCCAIGISGRPVKS